MIPIFKLRQCGKHEKVLAYTFAFLFYLMYFHVGIAQQPAGSETKGEPHISLKAENQPLGDVLNKITQDTGYKFKIKDQWSRYRISASAENMPLHRGLRLILRGFNHAIIYESNKSIKIVVLENLSSPNTKPYSRAAFSAPDRDDRQESSAPPESVAEGTENLKGADNGSEETGAATREESSDAQNEGADDQNEQKKAAEAVASESEGTNEQN